MRKTGILNIEEVVREKDLEIQKLKKMLESTQAKHNNTSSKIKTLTQQIVQLYNNNNFSAEGLSDEKSFTLIKTVVHSLEKKKSSLFQQINALNSLEEGIAIFDNKGKVNFHNQAFKNIIGAENSLTGIHWSNFFSKEDKFFICKKIIQLNKKEELLEEEFSFLGNNFKKITVVFKLSLIDDSNYLCTIKDITKDKDKNILIKQQSKLIEASSDFIGITDHNFKFNFLNEAAKKLIGISSTNLSIRFLDLIVSENENLLADFKYQLEVKGSWKGELKLQTKSGILIPINTQISIGSNTQKREKVYHIIIQDISERKKAFEKIIDAKNIAEKNMEIRQQFLANMSHEIRTPMNAIIGLSNLLADTKLNNLQKDYIDSIKLSSENLLVIINDILDLSKIESGKLTIESIPFSINKLMDSIEKTFQHKTKEKQLFFEINKDPLTPKTIIGDPTRLSQILINLVNNAIKFTQTGGIKIGVKTIQNKDNKVSLSFSIKDTGIGISANKLQTIFEAFTQEKQDTTRKFGGTGLGLAIVKQITEIQGGEISVNSILNKGSEFIVNLQFEIGEELSEPKNNRNKNSQSKLEKARILMAEDYPMNQLLAKSLFTKWGLNLDIVDNGIEAIEAVKNGNYDIILMDIQMPEMDGIEATLKIREAGIETPIIAVTAHAFKEEREKCLKIGMNDFIAKPFQEEDVFEKLIYFSNIKENDAKDIKKIELEEIDILNGKTSMPDHEDMEQFLLYAPELIHDFEKGIDAEDKYELKKSGILLQTLFHQINKKEFANQFYKLARGKKLQNHKYQELLMTSKALYIDIKNYFALPVKNNKTIMKVEMDLSQIKALAEDNDGFGKEMIELYINQSKEQLIEINKNVEDKEFLKVGGLIHSMKASFSMLNCSILSNLSIELEDGCKRNTLSEEEILDKLKTFKTLTEQSFETIIALGKSENLI